ncbi:MAG: prepilin-type N-terminal cleavage/methylation domain-containing protein [Endomicrobiaceae bacterium]|nr:prepilin-type N-terminal cleavage/methylation domain-containing protein [Endomicrobiaceae bacterium]
MKKGFTLVELVIVIVIVGILSIVAVPIYQGYIKKSITVEGKTLLGVIQITEKAYFAETTTYLDVPTTSFNETLDIDARANKYFTSFTIYSNKQYGDDARYTAITTTNSGIATGVSLTMIGQYKGQNTFSENI